MQSVSLFSGKASTPGNCKLAVRNGNKQITINVVTTIIIAIGCFITNFANLRHAFAGVCAT